MATMSFYSNSSASLQHIKTEVTTLPELPDPDVLLVEAQDDLTYSMGSCINNPTILGLEDCMYWNDISTYLSSMSQYGDIMSVSPELDYVLPDYEYCNFPKRQKTCHELVSCLDMSVVAADYINNVQSLVPLPLKYPLDLVVPMPQQLQADHGYGNANEVAAKKPSPKCLSSQSIAARQRRRKITKKTEELGKLIPGGRKMNTAQMLQAACMYVKFLQAQVGILQLNESIQKKKEEKSSEEEQLGSLLVCPSIQEKLHVEEKCLVTKELVSTLAKDSEIQLKECVRKHINQLMQQNGWCD